MLIAFFCRARPTRGQSLQGGGGRMLLIKEGRKEGPGCPDFTSVWRGVACWTDERPTMEGSVSSATLEHHDHGAGSRVKHGSGQTNREVSHLARHVLTQESDAEAMARWLRSLQTHGKVLELGTSLGLTAMHFVRSGWDVETWEGCPNTMAWARSGWQSLGVEGFVRSRVGTFQSMLDALDEHACWDVVFLDGHHYVHEIDLVVVVCRYAASLMAPDILLAPTCGSGL